MVTAPQVSVPLISRLVVCYGEGGTTPIRSAVASLEGFGLLQFVLFLYDHLHSGLLQFVVCGRLRSGHVNARV